MVAISPRKYFWSGMGRPPVLGARVFSTFRPKVDSDPAYSKPCVAHVNTVYVLEMEAKPSKKWFPNWKPKMSKK